MSSPINTFKTVTANLTTTDETIYTAPAGVTSIILMAQITNVTATPTTVTFSHRRNSVNTELVKDFLIADNDAISATTGKLILEQGDAIVTFAEANDRLKVTLSILESLNA